MKDLKPLRDYVVAKPEEPSTKTASGLYLPTKDAEKPPVAKVLAVGDDVKQVKVGDLVLHSSFAGSFKVEGKDYLVIKEEDIIATLV